MLLFSKAIDKWRGGLDRDLYELVFKNERANRGVQSENSFMNEIKLQILAILTLSA